MLLDKTHNKMKLKQEGKTGVNGLNYFDLCSDDFKSQFGYIAKKDSEWKLYISIAGEKNYFFGSFIECLQRAEELKKAKF